MNIEYFHDEESLSRRGAELVQEEIKRKKDLLLCAASGRSPYKTYEKIIQESEKDVQLFRNLRIIKLDEWWAIPSGSEGTCEHFIKEKLVEPLSIPDDRYISFLSDVADPELECKRIRITLQRQGPIDLAILGLGRNGHIGLNEPGKYIEPYCHLEQLSEQSRQHKMIDHMVEKPSFGMTLGIKEILSSQKILLIVAGEDKIDAARILFSGIITTECPATFLWLHDHTYCLVLQFEDHLSSKTFTFG
jgi:galactosamine-6-phosphate isomerase